MNSDIKRSLTKIRTFLFSTKNKEILIFLFFFFLSTAFWLSMALDETYEKEVNVPIRLGNVPKNAIITTDIPDTVTVTIRDKGFAILNYNSKRLRPVNLNFSTYANPETGNGNIPMADIQNIMYQRLSNSTHITSIKPDNFSFYFNYGESKIVPVRLKGNIKPAQSYYLAQTKIAPQEVMVYASKDMLDSLKFIDTERLDIVNFKESINKKVKLKKTTGIKTIPEQVTIKLHADLLVEESIEVPIIPINTPAEKTIRTFPARVKVYFNVGAEMYKMINEKQFKVVVDYLEISKNPSDKCTLHLQSTPVGVRQPHLKINKVDYVVEQNSNLP